jgi:multidrug efflux pump subunit AcrB
MKRIIPWFVENPVAANLLMLILIVGGIVSSIGIDNEFLPDFETGVVQVQVPYPGAGPLEVEEQICMKIEEAIADVEGIDEVQCTASQGLGSVRVFALDDWDVQQLLNEVKNQVDGISTFPANAEKPVVSELTMGKEVLSLVVYGGTDEQTIKAQAQDLKEELNRLAGVSRVQLGGVRDSVVSIEVGEQTLRKYGLTFNNIANVVREGSVNLPAGQMRGEFGEMQIQIYGQDYRARDFENLPVVASPDGAQLTLGDIASVRDTFQEKNFVVEYNGNPAVELTVIAGEHPDLIGTSTVVRDFIAKWQETLPPGFRVEVWDDSSDLVRDRLELLVKNSVQGLLLVFMLLLLFLRPALAVWVTAGIAVAYLGTLWVMPVMDLSINMVSTFAFLLILGIVVDDAIVVGENIYTANETGQAPATAAWQGAAGVAKPIILAVLTTVMVFLPMLSLPGAAAQIFMPFPQVAIAALTFSLVECLLILPSHLRHLAPEKPPANRFSKALRAVRQRFTRGLNHFSFHIYQPLLDRCLRHQGTTVASFLAALMIALSLAVGGWLPMRFTPQFDLEVITATVEMQEGAAFSHVRGVRDRLAAGLDTLRRDPGMRGHDGRSVIEDSFTFVEDNKVTFKASVLPSDARSVTGTEIASRWKQAVGEIPAAETFTIAASPFASNRDLSFRLKGRDLDQLSAASRYLQARLEGFAGVVGVSDSLESARQEIRVALKPYAETLGVELADVANQVRYAFYGAEAQRIPRVREDVKVMVRYPADQRDSIETLLDMRVRLDDGTAVPFTEVATANFVPGYTTLERVDRQRVVYVYADVLEGGVSANEIFLSILRNHKEALESRFSGVTLDVGGEQEQQIEFFDQLYVGMGFALFAIYLLLAVEFKSYWQPLIILSAVPFGIAGAIVGHLVMGMAFSMPSALGVLATAGVVVNDNLVLMDRINNLRREGTAMVDAVKRGARDRLRPILLTSLTTFFGLMPILMEPSPAATALKPLVVSLAFGVVFATSITLLMVPAIYLAGERLKQRYGFRPRAETNLG